MSCGFIYDRRQSLSFQLFVLLGLLLESCLTVNNTVLPTVAVNMTTANTNTKNNNKDALIFSQPKMDGLIQGKTQTVYFNYTGGYFTTSDINLVFQVLSADDSIAKVVDVKSSWSTNDEGASGSGNIVNNISNGSSISSNNLFIGPNNTQFQYTLVLSGEFMGRTYLKFLVPESVDSGSSSSLHTYNTINSNGGGNKSSAQTAEMYDVTRPSSGDARKWREIPEVYEVSVIRMETWVDYVFIGVISIVVFSANVFMGFKIDLDVVKEVLKKPFAPGIGFVCQFVLMPVVAYGLARLLKMEGGQALGLFAAGCAPGGGASNMYTYILGGDVSLSVTMTLVSTLASFGMIPLWLYTLGQHLIHNRYPISIPFTSIFLTLVGIIVPVGIGMLIQRKKPGLVVKLVKYLKPVFIILIIFLFTFGTWINRYLFRLFTPKVLIAGCLLPYMGYILAGIAAAVCRQPSHRVVTIIIETGIQNTGIPIILMRFSLPQPEADLAMISPIVVAMFTPFPLWIAFFGREAYRRCWKKKEKTRGKFDFQRVHTDSDISPDLEDDDGDTAMDMDSVITFDMSNGEGGDGGSHGNNNSKKRYLTEEAVT